LKGLAYPSTQSRSIPSGSARFACVLVLWVTAMWITSPVYAQDNADPTLEIGTAYIRDGILSFDLEVSGLFGGSAVEALHSGLPATVIVQWGILRHRSGWWDDKVISGSTFFRVFYDVLEQRYDLFDHTGRPLASSDRLTAIETALCSRRGLSTVRADHLDDDAKYMIEVLARLEPLDEQEINDLEAWARGQDEQDKPFLSSVSRRAIGWLKDLVGPEARSAWSTSDTFSVEDVERVSQERRPRE
jgi:hypothetical protein